MYTVVSFCFTVLILFHCVSVLNSFGELCPIVFKLRSIAFTVAEFGLIVFYFV